MQLELTHDGKKIVIRTAVEDDASLLLYWWNDGEVMAHAGFPLGLKTDIERVKGSIAKNGENRQLMIICCDDTPIGEMNFCGENNVYDFGIKICNASYQNNGLGVPIVRALFDYLFTEKGAEKITCDTNLRNIRAQKFYEEKLKMKRVKTIYNSFANQIGELQSATFFEITKDEYLNNK